MSASEPLLSVIVPTRNTRMLTLACLRSLEEAVQTDTVEVLVVDDASQDGTVEAIRASFPKVKLLRNPEPAGFTGAANRGLGEARGCFLLLLNSDTEVPAESLGALLDGFSDPELAGVGIIGARLVYPDGRSQWSGGQEPGLLWLFLLSSGLARVLSRWAVYRRLRALARPGASSPVRVVDWVTGAALALRREVLEQVGHLDCRFDFYAQDLDLCLRAKDAGWRVVVLTRFRVLHHHGASIARQRATVQSQHLELLWSDLLRWAEKRRGRVWSRHALRALRWGARWRIWILKLLLLVVRGNRRVDLRSTIRACERARGALNIVDSQDGS